MFLTVNFMLNQFFENVPATVRFQGLSLSLLHLLRHACANYSEGQHLIICYQLYELMYETEELRNSISTVSYVMNRTFLSRSSIMKILAQLKTGNYITMEKGILKAINNIPSRY
ncbi:helix-turn-helix domain-containing protein [Rahnella inusitata]|uniref:helix-turn-helix domain-containing protein n=1 Tax=Rahnella inusitata TaxID=58169 RepID=UPI0039AFF773